MPRIIPINNLKRTGEVSEMCHNSEEPVFITKNGYGDMVIMSIETYQRDLAISEVFHKFAKAEKQIENGEIEEARAVFEKLRTKHAE